MDSRDCVWCLRHVAQVFANPPLNPRVSRVDELDAALPVVTVSLDALRAVLEWRG